MTQRRLVLRVLGILSIVAIGLPGISAATGIRTGIANAAGSQETRLIPSAGTGSPQTGGFTPSGNGDLTQVEFPGQQDEADGSKLFSATCAALHFGTFSGAPVEPHAYGGRALNDVEEFAEWQRD